MNEASTQYEQINIWVISYGISTISIYVAIIKCYPPGPVQCASNITSAVPVQTMFFFQETDSPVTEVGPFWSCDCIDSGLCSWKSSLFIEGEQQWQLKYCLQLKIYDVVL